MKRTILFTVVHLFLVLIVSLHSFFIHMEFDNKNSLVSLVDKVYKLARMPISHEYAQFASVDAGYGFYGGNVATSKYFHIKFRNEEEELLFSGEFRKFFNSQNTYVRFDTLASKLYSTMVELEELQEQVETQENQEMKSILERRVKLQEKWIATIYKSLENFAVSRIKMDSPLYEAAVSGTIYYRTILPPDKLSTYLKNKKQQDSKKVVTIHTHNFHLK